MSRREITEVLWEMLENLGYDLEDDEVASNECDVAADKMRLTKLHENYVEAVSLDILNLVQTKEYKDAKYIYQQHEMIKQTLKDK